MFVLAVPFVSFLELEGIARFVRRLILINSRGGFEEKSLMCRDFRRFRDFFIVLAFRIERMIGLQAAGAGNRVERVIVTYVRN